MKDFKTKLGKKYSVSEIGICTAIATTCTDNFVVILLPKHVHRVASWSLGSISNCYNETERTYGLFSDECYKFHKTYNPANVEYANRQAYIVSKRKMSEVLSA